MLYIWQFQIEEQTIIGRTWEEFITLCEMLTSCCSGREAWVVYVHNLSYEFQFLAGIYPFQASDVFAMDRRKILKATMYNCIEFRCSYLHSNMSLDQYTHKWGVQSAKLSGFDYEKSRYPWTPLSDDELAYCVNDVRGLVQTLKKEMQMDGDNLYTIPPTSTGYVRRDLKQAMRTYNRSTLQRQLPDYRIYTMLFEAFRGGNTHANRYFSGQIIGGDEIPCRVYSFDRSSSYPDVQCNDLFPVGRWQVEEDVSPERVSELMNRRGKALLMRVRFLNIRLKDPEWGCPYLSVAKCREFIPRKKRRGPNGEWIYPETYDNGRILGSELLATTITDVDLKIIMEEYDWDAVFFDTIAHSTYGRLPGQLVEQIEKYYTTKTELKGAEPLSFEALLYAKDKEKLNAIYGNTVMNPVKPEIMFGYHPEETDADYALSDEYTPEELLRESNRRAYMSYAWGIWTTAYARYRLEQGIRIAHNPRHGCYFVYADTDSVKWFADTESERKACFKRWAEFNRRATAASRKNRAFATDRKGTTHYMGVFELDAEYDKFITLGAKKYACIEDGALHITVAGVGKKLGAAYLADHGGIEAFQEGFVFPENHGGGTESIYNDYPEIQEYLVDGHQLHITRNVVIRPTTKTLGITGDYAFILENPAVYRKIFDEKYDNG